jgi:hypothetical protein
LGVFLIACAPARINLPGGPGTPFPEFADVHKQISSACTGVRTMTAEVGLSGRAGEQRLRGINVVAGFVRPSAMRLEAVVAGQLIFILAAPDENGVLFLTRESEVLRKARPESILEALIGVNLAPADLLAILSGCVVPNGSATNGQRYANGWASIEVTARADSSKAGAATLYLQRVGDQWQLRVARRSGWRIDYPAWQGQFPASVRLLSDMQPVSVDLTATISQLETNIDLEAAELAAVKVPPGATELTLDELRRAGPLRGP